jgi:hypothetical protein
MSRVRNGALAYILLRGSSVTPVWSSMKKLITVVMMLFAGSAIAEEPSLFQKMQACTFYATKATEYTVFAKAIKPEDVSTYITIVQHDVDSVDSPRGKTSIAFIGEVAWKNRLQAPTEVGMAVYNDCLAKSGTKT